MIEFPPRPWRSAPRRARGARPPGASDRLEDRPRPPRRAAAVCGASRSLAAQVERSPALSTSSPSWSPGPPLPPATPASSPSGSRSSTSGSPRATCSTSTRSRDHPAGVRAREGRDHHRGPAHGAPGCRLAVVAMGKFGGDELNYASDIDVMFVGDGPPDGWTGGPAGDGGHPAELPGGRQPPPAGPAYGASVRSSAPTRRTGTAGPSRGSSRRCSRPGRGRRPRPRRRVPRRPPPAFGPGRSAPTTSRQLRHLKARAEADLARQGLTDREVKRAGVGSATSSSPSSCCSSSTAAPTPASGRRPRSPPSPKLADAGYVDGADVEPLAEAYVFLRRLEHRLQLFDGSQVYAMPVDEPSRLRIRPDHGAIANAGSGTALEHLDAELGRHQGTVRGIHERLDFWAPLEAFAGTDAGLLTRPGAIDERLAAFGFSDGKRHRAAVRGDAWPHEVVAVLMQQLLPLLLGWLSESPDPDLGPAQPAQPGWATGRGPSCSPGPSGSHRTRRGGSAASSARPAWRPTSSAPTPDLVERLPDEERLRTQPREVLADTARLAGTAYRPDRPAGRGRRWKERHLFGVAARDLEGWADPSPGGPRHLPPSPRRGIEVALELQEPGVPIVVIALGRFGGHELSYASDLDLVIAYEGTGASDAEEGQRVAAGLRRFLHGGHPRPPALGRRPRPAPRRQAGSHRGASTATAPTSTAGRSSGSARPCCAPAWSPATRPPVRRSPSCSRTSCGNQASPTTTVAKDPPAQGPHREGAAAGRRRPGVPLEAGARARCRTWSGPREPSGLRHRVRATGTLEALDELVAEGVMPPAERRRPRRVLPLLRGHAEPAVPRALGAR